MTGYGRPQDVNAALAAGFSAHFDQTTRVDMNRLFSLVIGAKRRLA